MSDHDTPQTPKKKKIPPSRRTHGFTTGGKVRRIYVIWMQMLARCRNQNSPAYVRYGGSGISVCERWKKFQNFFDDMGDPAPHLTIDRIDNDGNYEPGNCRWATRAEQRRNQRNVVRLTFQGKTQSLREWAQEIGISIGLLSCRLKLGWSVEEALTKPKRMKTTEDDRSRMKELHEGGMSYKAIGKLFSRDQRTVSSIIRGKKRGGHSWI